MKILIIQTAFIGDVILATPVVESIHDSFPTATIDFLLRRGNESLFSNHPIINHVWIWDKKENKYRNQFRLITSIRKEKYDYVINLQRFLSTGIYTACSSGRQTIGFDKNPLSKLFSKSYPHVVDTDIHEVDRNLSLLTGLADTTRRRPSLYPSTEDFQLVQSYKQLPYCCIAPTSVWYTKQFPIEQWHKLIPRFPEGINIYLLGGPGDHAACEKIRLGITSTQVTNLAGKLNLLQSAALMKDAEMNYVNDSAPMHIASAMNAPTVAIFCNTVPAFGFGPLAEQSTVIEIDTKLECRPCHLHGLAACPKGHFKCAMDIDLQQIPIPPGTNALTS